MTGTQDPPASWRDGARLLAEDLVLICGTLSEIATVWRRAKPCLPGLPLMLPEQLQSAARDLAADIQALADAGLVWSPDETLSAADRVCALKQGIASARVMTCGPGIAEVGDSRLWEFLSTPLRRAEAQLPRAGADHHS